MPPHPQASNLFEIESVLTIIPAHNEEGAIQSVIQKLHQQGIKYIRVVDNASKDNTVINALSAGAEVIHEPTLGYGMACWRGLQNISPQIKWILFCDGDGCDDIASFPAFITAVEYGNQFVIANRLSSPASYQYLTIPQRFGNILATKLIALFWGHQFHDLGPMRMIQRELIESMQMQSRGFGWTVEMQIRIAELNIPWQEVPVTYLPRIYGKSKISGTIKGVVLAGTVIITTIVKHGLRKFLSLILKNRND